MPAHLPLPEPLLIWGLVSRAVGLIFLIAHASLVPQLVAVVGERGLMPLGPRLARQRKDTPSLVRLLHTPTLFWLNSSDLALRAVPLLGALGGAAAVYGGEAGFWGLLVAWLCFLSIEQTSLTIFPWDTMLLEVGFLALFLPEAQALPAWEAATLPLPAVAFMLRWLLARLMLGFGRLKFWGSRREDDLYLRGFLSWQPVPNRVGWYAQHAPAWFLRGSLYFMFFTEVCAPLLALIAGVPRLIGAACLACLMMGIQLTGNWGYFNLGYALLCIAFLDVDSSIFDLAAPGALSGSPEVLAVNLTMGVLFLVSIPYLLLDSWSTRSWITWGLDWVTIPHTWLRWLTRALRVIAPFRVVNGYGVFPPRAISPVRMTPVFEGSLDGNSWQAYGYRYLPSQEHEAPSFVAPHHPRFDQTLQYGMASTDASFLGPYMGDGSPYTCFRSTSWLQRVMQSLLRGEAQTARLFAHNPFEQSPPRYMRVSLYALAPTSLAQKRRTGRFWRRRRVGSLVPATQLDAFASFAREPVPELFHPDAVESKRRCPALENVRAAARRGLPLDEAVLVDREELTPHDVERFWADFVPFVGEQMGRWDAIRARVSALRERFDPDQLFRFERLLERYAWILSEVVEPFAFGQRTPALPAISTFQRHLLLHQAILDGRDALARYYREPARVVERQKSLGKESALYPIALLRWDAIDYQIRSFRWVELVSHLGTLGLPGIPEFFDMLRDQKPTEEDWLPTFHKQPNGEWLVPGLIEPELDARGVRGSLQDELG